MHLVRALLTTFGLSQFTHVPDVEYEAPTQSTQAVRLSFGPLPAWHFEQLVRSMLMTLGESHETHLAPKLETFVPTQSIHRD